MKAIITTALLLGISFGTIAQNQSTNAKNTTNGVTSPANPNETGSAEGLKRKGNGQESEKMKSGVSRNGNSNLSPTGPTNTQGSTSQGNATVRSNGGAAGTNTRSSGRSNTNGGVKGSLNSRNNTATDGGTMGPGATGGNSRNTTHTQEDRMEKSERRTSTSSTSGYTGGSRRPTSNADVQKEARTNDRNVGTGYAEPTGPGKPGTPAGNAKGKKNN